MTIFTNDSPIVGASYQCLKCDKVHEINYDIPISFVTYQRYKYEGQFQCQDCHTRCEPIAKFKEPEPEIQPQKMESMEEWLTSLKKSYDALKTTIEENLPQLWLPIEFILSVRSIMNIQGVTLPWFSILLGRPSSLKTAGIEALRDTPGTFYVDIFTPKAFVSNSTAVSKDKLKDIDMLPKIKNQLFLVSELSAIFTKKDDELVELLGVFTRLADGHGLTTHTGAHGERFYRDIYFNMIGAAVDIPRKVYKYLGYLRPKLYFLRLPKSVKSEDKYVQEMDQVEYPVRFQKVRSALNDYLTRFLNVLTWNLMLIPNLTGYNGPRMMIQKPNAT